MVDRLRTRGAQSALTIWQKLDGLKTTIGTVAFLGYMFCEDFLGGVWQVEIDPRITESLKWVGVLFGSVGSIHKIIKQKRGAL